MQSVAVLLVLVAAASANTVFRVPSADSAVISSQRVGGNFAYSTHESPAYGVVSPVVSHVTSPVATTYSVQQPAAVHAQVAATTYAVQQPASAVVSASTLPVASTYASWPHSYWYGGNVAPTTYAVQSNVVDTEQVKHVVNNVQVQPQQAVTYTVQHQQPQQVQQAVTYSVQQPQQAVTYTVQQPQQVQVNQQVNAWAVHNKHGESTVATGTPVNVATTYTAAVQQPISVVSSVGTPASTVGVNTWGYGVGQPWVYNNAWNNVIV